MNLGGFGEFGEFAAVYLTYVQNLAICAIKFAYLLFCIDFVASLWLKM